LETFEQNIEKNGSEKKELLERKIGEKKQNRRSPNYDWIRENMTLLEILIINIHNLSMH